MRIQGLDQFLAFDASDGYISSAAKEAGGNYMAAGSENAFLTGAGKVVNHRGSTRRAGVKGGFVMQNVAETFASLGQTSDITAYGSVMNVFAALFYIGKGLVRLAGSSLLTNASATLSLLIKHNGSYTDAGSGPFQAGLSPPSAPIIRAVDPPGGMTGKVTGTVSVTIWRIRSTTGAVSNQSPVSNIVTANAQSISIQFPLLDANGQDAWGIGVTKQIEGRTGSHFAYAEIMDTDLDNMRAYVVEWRDGDLVGREFAPSRSFPPPVSALFAGTLQDVLFVDGAYGDSRGGIGNVVGTAICPSEPGQPEAFSPDTAIFTSDTPTALLKGDRLYWRFGRNTLHAITYLGGTKPIAVESVWDGTGIQFQNQACIGEGGRLYLWPSTRGLLRMGQDGLPEGTFAAAISDDLAACTDASKRVLGTDGISQTLCACYEKNIWPYFTSLGKWGSRLTFPTNIRSAVTENNQLVLCDENDDLWNFGIGLGSTAKIRTPWKPSSGGLDTVAAIITAVRADNTGNITINVYADGDETMPVSTFSVAPSRTGYSRLDTVWPNLNDCQSFQVEIIITSTTATGNAGLESVQVFGETHDYLV